MGRIRKPRLMSCLRDACTVHDHPPGPHKPAPQKPGSKPHAHLLHEEMAKTAGREEDRRRHRIEGDWFSDVGIDPRQGPHDPLAGHRGRLDSIRQERYDTARRLTDGSVTPPREESLKQLVQGSSGRCGVERGEAVRRAERTERPPSRVSGSMNIVTPSDTSVASMM